MCLLKNRIFKFILTGSILVILLFAVSLLGMADAAEHEIRLIHGDGEPARFDISILPDGYSHAEMGKFEADARNIVTYLFRHPLFSQRQDHFNFRIAMVPSQLSSWHMGNNWYGNYFNTKPGYNLDWNRTVGYIDRNMPYTENWLVLMNTQEFGGVAWVGNGAIIPSSNISTEYVFIHEFGHSFGLLNDEYDGMQWPFETPNFSRNPWGKWGDLIGQRGIGAYHQNPPCEPGWYRPSNHCVMRNWTFDFCAVCERSINTRLNEIKNRLPNPTPTHINPTALYNFNHNSGNLITDSSSNKNNATVVNGASWIAGKQGKALAFNGVNQYASLPLGITCSLNDFTIATWIKIDESRTWSRIFDFGIGTNHYMYLTPRSGGNRLRFAITTNGHQNEQAIQGPMLPTGVWKHVAITKSGNIAIMYVDGVEVGRNNNMNIKPSDLGITNQNWLGRSQWADPYLRGAIDEFKIYNSAMSQEEIDNLIQMQYQIWYNFDQSEGNTVVNTSWIGGNGTVVNGGTWVYSKVRYALFLNGEGQHVRLPNGIVNRIDDFTISFWVNISSTRPWARIFDFGTGTDKYMYLTPQSGSNRLRFAITNNGWANEQAIEGPALQIGVWKHITITKRGNIGEMYVDGIRVGRNTNMTIKPLELGNTNRNYLGRSQWTDPYFAGVIDEFKIMNTGILSGQVGTRTTKTAHYKFDEVSGSWLSDAISANDFGKLPNGAKKTPGKHGRALELNGINQYVSFRDGVMADAESFTIAMWVKINESRPWARIFDFGTGTDKYMYLTPESGSKRLRFAITNNNWANEQAIEGPSLPIGVWKHIAVTLSGNTGILYVDGIEVGRNKNMTIKPMHLGNTNNNWLGRSQWSDPYLKGTLDDFRIYGSAISGVSIRRMMNGNY